MRFRSICGLILALAAILTLISFGQTNAGDMEPPKTFTNSLGMKFVLIPAGSFMMGSSAYEIGRKSDEGPQHQVTINKPYYLQTMEVTQGQWRSLMYNNPNKFKGDDLPMEKVSWDEAQEFIRNLNAKEGTSKYRLPTEAEWEYACRAGSITKYGFGDDWGRLGDYAWYEGNSGGQTHPVGEKQPNNWGLYDMHGNVWEWCSDWYGAYPSTARSDTLGPSTGRLRVYRGGSWRDFSRLLRSTQRKGNSTTARSKIIGFRVAKDL